MSWYAIHVRSNCEQIVARKLDADGIENFYPHAVTKSRDGRREIEQKFMPGYVFSRFDLAQRAHIVAITQVVGILGSGRHAIAIPEGEIESVRRIVSFPEAEPCPYFFTGQKVRVKHGALTGLEGHVLHSQKRTFVVVSLTAMERSIRAEVDPRSLELIGHAVPTAACSHSLNEVGVALLESPLLDHL
jgi:transcription antitermination factor NusG